MFVQALETDRATGVAQMGRSDGGNGTRPKWLLTGAAFLLLVLAWTGWLLGLHVWRTLALSGSRQSLRQFDADAACVNLERLLQWQPDCAEAEFLLAAACRRANRLDLAGEHLERAAELGWDPKALDRQRYLMYFQIGDLRTSGPYLKELLLEGGSNDEADETYEAMARGYMAGLHFNEAKFVLEQWLDWRKENAQACLLKADVALMMNDQAGEAAAYRQILEFDPHHLEARHRLARLLLTQHDWDAAQAVIAGCRRDAPQDPGTMLLAAEWHQRHGESSQARQIVASVLKSQLDRATRTRALDLAGQLALSEKDYPAAIQALEQAVKHDPSDSASVYSLSQALLRSGHEREAKPYLERWQRMQVLDEQLEDMHDAMVSRPDDPDLRYQIGAALLEKGDARAGVNWLLSALLHDAAHVPTHQRLADHFEQTGQESRAHYHRALASGKFVSHGAKAAFPVLTPAGG